MHYYYGLQGRKQQQQRFGKATVHTMITTKSNKLYSSSTNSSINMDRMLLR